MSRPRWTVGLPDPADPRHGTLNGYRACGCRCERCTAVNTDYQQQIRIRHEADRKHCTCSACVRQRRTLYATERTIDLDQRRTEREQRAEAMREKRVGPRSVITATRRAELLANDDDPRHGRVSTYSFYNCRCLRCTKAFGAAMNHYRLRRMAAAS